MCIRKEVGFCSVTYKNKDVFQVLNVGMKKYGEENDGGSIETITTTYSVELGEFHETWDDFIFVRVFAVDTDNVERLSGCRDFPVPKRLPSVDRRVTSLR